MTSTPPDTAGEVFEDETQEEEIDAKDLPLSPEEAAGLAELEALGSKDEDEKMVKQPDGAAANPTSVTEDEEKEEQMAEKENVAAAAVSSTTTTKPPGKNLHHEPNIDKNSSIRLTENVGPSEVDWRLFTVGLVMLMVVIGIAVGVGVGVTSSNKNANDASTSGTTDTDSSTTPSTPMVSDNNACPQDTKMQYEFSTNAIVTLAVDPAIGSTDIDYTASLLQKAYGEMDSFYVENACDPYYRTVSSVTNTGSSVLGDNITTSNGDGEDCSYLNVTFQVMGTYWACEDVPFPGLFAMPSSDAVATVATTRTSNNGGRARGRGRTLLRIRDRRRRGLQSPPPACPDDAALFSPLGSPQQLEIVSDFVSALPSVCALVGLTEESDNA